MLRKFVKKLLKKKGYEIYRRNFYDFNDLQALGKIFPRDSYITIFDIGANAGQTVARFKKFWPNSIIHSFEPDPDVFMELQQNTKEFKNVHLYNTGVGDKNEIKKFFKMTDSGSSSFIPINKESRTYNILNQKENLKYHNKTTPKISTDKTVDCRITTLDDFCDKNKIGQIHILKMDVQGYEPNVLKGASKLFSENKVGVILTEVMFTDYYSERCSFFDIESQIKDHNFILYDIPYLARVPTEHEQRIFFIDAIYANVKQIAGI